MNDKKILMDKQNEMRLRAEHFLSREKTPASSREEYDALLGDFEEFFNDLEISDELRPLKKIWDKLRLLDEIYDAMSQYIDIDETEIIIEFGDQNNNIERIGLEELQMHVDDIFNMSEEEKLKLRAAPFLLGRKTPTAQNDEYCEVHDDLINFIYDSEEDAPLQEIYSKLCPLGKILDKLHLLDEIYGSMSQLNIDETEVAIKFKNQNNDIEYAWSDDFQMHIDYVFQHANIGSGIQFGSKEDSAIVVGQVECGMLCSDDTVLINGRAYDISGIVHEGFKAQVMNKYAKPGMNIALVLKGDRPFNIMLGALVTKKEVSE